MEVDAIQSKKATVRPLSGDELLESFPGIRIPVNPGYAEIYDTEFFESFYRWYQTHPLAVQIYRWAAFTPEGEAVGHLAAMPQAYRINGQRVIAHTPGDYMVLPGYGFQALSNEILLPRHRKLRYLRHGAGGDIGPESPGRRAGG
ncbi:hypothetical protein BH20ACT11_BH20ACT11_17050 [soil metagenome]